MALRYNCYKLAYYINFHIILLIACSRLYKAVNLLR